MRLSSACGSGTSEIKDIWWKILLVWRSESDLLIKSDCGTIDRSVDHVLELFLCFKMQTAKFQFDFLDDKSLHIALLQ